MTELSLTRRTAFVSAAAAGFAAWLRPHTPALASEGADRAALAAFAKLEQRAGGRLGVVLIQGERIVGNRPLERFALCSTFKLPLAALALREVARGRIEPTEKLAFGEADLLGWAPVSRARVQEGALSVQEAAEASQVHSDNTAANLLLKRLGGMAAYNAFLREIGDQTTRLDGMEPAVGYVAPDGIGNTTTPEAIARTVLALAQGAALPPDPRATLLAWMRATTTGPRRLKAGIPSAWGLAHKTGTQAGAEPPNLSADVGVAFPPGRPPLAIAAYYEAPVSAEQIRPEDEAVLAEVGRIAAGWAA